MEAAAAPLLLGILLLSLSPLPLTAQSNSSAKPGCPNTCGSLTIPYPFGIGSGCYLAEDSNMFPIDCDLEANPPVAYWRNRPEMPTVDGLSVSRFQISRTKNMFTAIGCDTFASFAGTVNNTFNKTCTAGCNNNMANTTWSGFGYCQMSVPWDCKDYRIDIRNFNRCGYGFVAEKGYFNFSAEYLLKDMTNTTTTPVIVEWSIPGEECDEAQQNHTTFACKENTNCTDVMSGYQCQCKEGYGGNPYLSGENGCQDIDECVISNPCNVTSMCTNLPGSFTCSCPEGFNGDGLKNGTGCSPIIHSKYISQETALGLSSSFGMVLLIFLAWWTYKIYKKRRRAKLKEKYFKQNGGLILQEQLISHEGNAEKGKLFDYKELKVATNNFHTDRILGKGGQGTVYKGMLLDGKIIAIKKALAIDEVNIEQFINEVIILSQINHRNVVNLLGYCLECETPLLVYEFIPNGTLYQYIHEQEYPISWEARIRIATEIAGALFYLHSSASIPIYHRDIKSSNILLDEKYRAKIADFGTSRSVSLDQTHVTTVVQGTFGYLDPEYFQSSQFTEKSDVYSFGVVLVELLTGQKPLSLVGANEGRSLATYFVMSMDGNRLFDILDALVLEKGKKEEIVAVANLAKRCLNLKGRKRPTMKEVVLELEGISKSVHGASRIEETQQDTEWNIMEAGTSGAMINTLFASGGHETECTTISISDDHPLLPTQTW